MTTATPPPLITISVVSHGHRAAIGSLLESLSRFEDPQQLQVILTDNLGGDLPDMGAASWKSLVIRRNERPTGFAANQNAAFRDAKGDLFCVINPDVVFVESALGALVMLLSRPGNGIVAPLVRDSEGRLQDSFRSLPSPWELVRRRTTHVRFAPDFRTGEVLHPDWIAGMFLLMQRETFSALGGFDERYQLYFEDVDLCTRARLTGREIAVATDLQIQHNAAHASRRPGRYLLWHTASALRFFASSSYRRARQAKRHA